MKKVALLTIGLFMLFSVASFGQGKALGLRFGGGNLVGAEISYQTPFAGERLELDLGWGGNSNWNYWNIAAIYQWLMPIEGGFKWYLGLGPSLGSWNYVGNYDDRYDGGLSLSLALNAGIEYSFSEIPLQLSIDTRPELGLINHGDDRWLGLALGIRYKF